MVRVLVVDDSEVMLKILKDSISSSLDMEVVGTAKDPYEARDKILELKPDVLTLDIEMPRMNGLVFLKKLMKYFPMPVVMVSSLTKKNSEASIEALESGAAEVICKPATKADRESFNNVLKYKVRSAALTRVEKRPPVIETPIANQQPPLALKNANKKIIAIGASTGGIDALIRVMSQMPADSPGTVICQHLPENFTTAFANRLNDHSPMTVIEANGNDVVKQGHAVLARGGIHMVVRPSPEGYITQLKDGPKVHYQRPAVEVMFNSVARVAGGNAIGVILTGMGADGATGMLKMRQAGAFTIAQDEATSVVYGMPKVAADIGAAERILPLNSIPGKIVSTLRERG